MAVQSRVSAMSSRRQVSATGAVVSGRTDGSRLKRVLGVGETSTNICLDRYEDLTNQMRRLRELLSEIDFYHVEANKVYSHTAENDMYDAAISKTAQPWVEATGILDSFRSWIVLNGGTVPDCVVDGVKDAGIGTASIGDTAVDYLLQLEQEVQLKMEGRSAP